MRERRPSFVMKKALKFKRDMTLVEQSENLAGTSLEVHET